MSDGALRIAWRAPGPVAHAFYSDRSRVSAIMGPIGSGKTGTALMRIIAQAQEQRPHSDGVRRSKWAVVRDTYTNLEKTTIKSWHAWVPRDVGAWGADPPAHAVKFGLPDGTVVDLVVEFIGLGDQSVETVMRGWEGTGAYINEADTLSPDVLTFLRGRVGRYPSKALGGASWWGVLLDFNAPDTDSWPYKRFIEDRPKGWSFHRQPSGLSPRAENVANLVPGYYAEQMEGQPEWYIRRFIRNEFGFSRDGKPVYPEFTDEVHVAKVDLLPDRRRPLGLGFDAGGTPAMVVTQRTLEGQWRVLDELVVENTTTMGAKRFGAAAAQLLAERYKGWHLEAWGDPSAGEGADKEAGELDWLQIVGREIGVRIRPAPTNRLTPRLEAVRQPLTRMVDGSAPAFMLSPRCKKLRKGFNSHYRYRRVAVGEGRYADKPEKNEWSHVHDALQYPMLGGGEYLEVMGRTEAAAGSSPEQADTDYDVHEPG
jgi:hypothetical protein